MNQMIYKGGGIVTDVDVKTRTIKGYYSVFGNKDSDGQVIDNGAYTKTIAEWGPKGKNRIMHLWMHEIKQVLAKPCELDEDDNGLRFVSCFPDEEKQTTLQSDVIKLYDQGIITEHSVGFQTIKNRMQDDTEHLTEVRLWEGSTVTWGANDLAKVTELKSEMKPELISRMDRLIKAIRDGKFTDETFYMLEYELTIIKSQIDSLEHQEPDIVPLLVTVEPDTDGIIKLFKSNLLQ
jgi:HK97 family phage prohead protease